ncbi:MAG: hypothetical protein ACE5DI_03595 [Candidatus Micrarchaeia archaeon]
MGVFLSLRAQTSSEFMLITGFVLVLVGFFMLQAFQESELTLGIAAARAGALNFTAFNPALRLAYLNYSVDVQRRVVLVRPRFSNFSEGGDLSILNDSLKNGVVYAWQQQFHPKTGASVFTSDNCVNGSFYRFCLQPCYNYEASGVSPPSCRV